MIKKRINAYVGLRRKRPPQIGEGETRGKGRIFGVVVPPSLVSASRRDRLGGRGRSADKPGSSRSGLNPSAPGMGTDEPELFDTRACRTQSDKRARRVARLMRVAEKEIPMRTRRLRGSGWGCGTRSGSAAEETVPAARKQPRRGAEQADP
jgi:hypothetical protein